MLFLRLMSGSVFLTLPTGKTWCQTSGFKLLKRDTCIYNLKFPEYCGDQRNSWAQKRDWQVSDRKKPTNLFPWFALLEKRFVFYQGQGESDYSANPQQVFHQTFTFAAANYLTPAESSYQGLYISLQTGKTTHFYSSVCLRQLQPSVSHCIHREYQ